MRQTPCSQTNQNVPKKYQFLPPAGSGRWGGGVSIPADMETGARVATSHTQRQNSGWGVPAGRFGIFQFVAKFATGRNSREG